VKKLILALDMLDLNEATSLTRKLSDLVDLVKINYPLVLSSGTKAIGELAKIKPVIADFKIADVPHISSRIADLGFKFGASSVIVHGFVVADVLRSVLEVARKYGGKTYVVTELSHPGGREFMEFFSERIAENARELGCDGIIAPATRVSRLKLLRRIVEDMEIFCPGVGVQGGKISEVAKYCDGIIVGRSIYLSEDPRKEAISMRRALDEF